MNTEKVTTRIQLQSYGATRYQAEVITKNLISVSKQDRAYAYAVSDVIASIRGYLQRPRIKPTTSHSLKAISQVLQQRLNNIIEVPFCCATDPEINKLARQLNQAMSRTDSALAELKTTATTIKAKYNI